MTLESREFDIDKMKSVTNLHQKASLRRTLKKSCSKCKKNLEEVGGTAFRTSSGTWYCYNCSPMRRFDNESK